MAALKQSVIPALPQLGRKHAMCSAQWMRGFSWVQALRTTPVGRSAERLKGIGVWRLVCAKTEKQQGFITNNSRLLYHPQIPTTRD
jgi:hypothetical protein